MTEHYFTGDYDIEAKNVAMEPFGFVQFPGAKIRNNALDDHVVHLSVEISIDAAIIHTMGST